ncbi:MULTISPECIES: manganese efflux pump MntP family protein [Bacillaceae]|jgi:putative Mn2+ efflux pump MntP|uniref:Putative manganese efflux pump MntP n=1 Tax=Sutcliffiella horikoshii TaxID=79883 RepID=A0A5D4T2X6_9BACI|nr:MULTISPECIES: manganese efflux pump MntP family protein [Bacillaceae]NLP51774.1 manganese efflux pump [Bacillus sp. RO1]NMH73838.1 manganese efflux pump [Bacillus sp. RO2]TYS69639.1 manganese efflux pump [Sutcliffiella horikoshii]
MGITFGEFMTLLLMAIALGMDAFSVGLGMGMIKLRLRQIFYIGVTIGIFHIFMPLGGMAVGKVLSEEFGSIATLIGGLLLVLLGLQMMFSSFKEEDGPMISPVGAGLFVFALSVSLDSFSVGLSLGIYGARTLLTILLFGAVSMLLTWMGLIFGRKLQGWLGSYSEALGGSILLGFGIKLLFFV